MKNIHIENSYTIWNKYKMYTMIIDQCYKNYGNHSANDVLNRTYAGMYIEWYIHNIGYWITIIFIKNKKIKVINERFKHVDLEEHS